MQKGKRFFQAQLFSLMILLSAGSVFAAPAAVATAVPGSIQDQAATLWQLIVAGGVCMIFQGLLSVLGLALIIYHFKTINVNRLVPVDFSENLTLLLEKKEYDKAISMSKQQDNLISRIALKALPRIARGKLTPMQAEGVIQAEGKVHIEKMWQNLAYLGDVAVVSPLLGLLGTVLGIVHAFHYFKGGSIHPGVLTQGLAKAMVNTVFGLIVAVICLVFYAYFRGKVSEATSRAESAATEMVHALSC